MDQKNPSSNSRDRDRILTSTITAVREQKAHRRLFIFQNLSQQSGNPATSDHDSDSKTLPESDTSDLIYPNISIADDQGARTVTLSHDEFSKLVFDPRLEYSSDETGITWESETTIIYMPFESSFASLDLDFSDEGAKQ
jgi:hypothetical protein